MRPSVTIAGYGVCLLAVFAATTGLGATVGTDAAEHRSQPAGPGAPGSGGAEAPGTGDDAEIPGGLMVAQNGYTLRLARAVRPAEERAETRFTIAGPDGDPVTRYTQTHGKDLHLIVVRRDLTGYQHVHPERTDAGTWSTTLDLAEPGEYRVFADFRPDDEDEATTLGADLSVAGTYRPQALPAPTRTSTVGDYTVDLDGDLRPGQDARLALTVRKNGRPVNDLQPYLEAYGHLVALRDGDLAYLHVHPDGVPGDGETEPGPRITFNTSVPSSGDYRLFLDFKHKGEVRTAAFTVGADGAPSGQHDEGPDDPPGEHDDDQH